MSDNLCGMCGIREATWPEPCEIGGIKNTQIWCQPCANKVIAEVALDAHIDYCDKCHYMTTEFGDVPVLVCDEGKSLYAEYQEKAMIADDAE